MAEAEVHTDLLRVGVPLTLGAVTLLPIERTVLYAGFGRGGPWWLASKHLHALIVRDAEGIRAVDADGQPMPLAVLRQQFSELDRWLAQP
jgi:hypothetical protein